MRGVLSLCVPVLLLTTALSRAADDAPAPMNKDKPDPSAEKTISLGSVAGVVQTTPGEDGLLKIKVTIRYLEANVQAQTNLLREEQHLIARQQAALQIRNPLRRQQEYLRILQSAQNMGSENLFRVKEVQREIELQTGDDTKYRTVNAPVAFDDKGNPKVYTTAELKELKGPENLAGYPVEKDALHKGQTVVVAAAHRRLAPGEKELAEEKPIATLILIAGEK